MFRTLTRAASAATLSLAILAAVPTLAQAGGPATNIQIGGDARLQPDGSATLTIQYSCLPSTGAGTTGTLFATLQQTQAFGSNGATVTCDDQNHTLALNLPPGPFTKGDAAADVDLTTGYADTNVNAEVEVGGQPGRGASLSVRAPPAGRFAPGRESVGGRPARGP